MIAGAPAAGRDRARAGARRHAAPPARQARGRFCSRRRDNNATFRTRPRRDAPGQPRTRVSRKYAEGSCLAKFGDTHVLCTATVEERVPPFLRNTGKGWVTAEYGMLPRSTHTRTDREAARGRQSGRTQEIQRLIGRSLRAVTDLAALGERQITHRLRRAAGRWRHPHRRDHRQLCRAPPGASATLVDGRAADGAAAARQRRGGFAAASSRAMPVLDLDYAEDSQADDRRQFRADRRRAASSRSRRPPKARRSTRRCSPQMLRLARAGHRRADPAPARGARRSAERWRAASAGDRLVIASHNPGKVDEIAALLAPFGDRDRRRGGARPARAGGNRRQLRGQCRAEGARRRRGAAACRRSPTIPGSSCRRWAARRGSIRRAGPARPRISASRWSGCSASSATRTAAPISSRCWRWPGPTARSSCSAARSHGRLIWPPRGDRGFGYDPMFVPDGDGDDLRRDRPGREAPDQPSRPRLRRSWSTALSSAWPDQRAV